LKCIRNIILVVAVFAVGALILAYTSSLLPFRANPAGIPTQSIPANARTPADLPPQTGEAQPGSTSAPAVHSAPNVRAFLFASAGDAQDDPQDFPKITNAIAALQPDLLIFNGDLESKGVRTSELDGWVAGLKSAGLFDRTFLVRGNHDNDRLGSASAWEKYFSTAPNIKTLPAGVSNYVAIDSNSTYLTYSFDYGNSRFIGLDAPGDAHVTTAQFTFLDQRLADAENLGLVHAFIYFHGPEYCIEKIHCSCTAREDASCTQAKFIDLINRHPIVSATFHGHEHILGWVHMDATRISGLSHPYEEFFTSPSGAGSYNEYIFPDRVDYYYPDMPHYYDSGFGTITVDGNSFTVTLYKVGTAAPVWSKTFTK
jgi:hypothetical protein